MFGEILFYIEEHQFSYLQMWKNSLSIEYPLLLHSHISHVDSLWPPNISFHKLNRFSAPKSLKKWTVLYCVLCHSCNAPERCRRLNKNLCVMLVMLTIAYCIHTLLKVVILKNTVKNQIFVFNELISCHIIVFGR